MSTATAPNTLSAESPWPGLRPFGEDDRSFFFGRERETAELLTLVQRSGVVIVYGQSGLGKTSLLQAGVFHGLRDLSLLPFRLRIDHGDAAPPAATQIKTALIAALDAAGVQGPRPDPDETLWEYFHRRDLDLWGARNRLIKPVITFDQFEEVFTIGQRSEKALARVAGLVDDLESLLEHRAPESVRARLEQRPDDALKYDFQHEGVKFIISLREDFLAQLDTWRTRLPSLLPNRFRLERMTGGQALEVVERAGGALVDPAVAKEIVDFVSRSQRRAQTGALQARNVEPALLSVVCDELNRRRLNRNQARITPDLLSGEREGIIAGFYARAFEDVDPRARDWVEEELLTASGYRDRAAQEDALRSGVKEPDLDKLVDRRILHREERDGVVWLELTHDLLTDPAYASHTQREQRRVAEEATRREAETAMRLRRTTRLAAGFAVLSLAMVVAVIYAFTMSRRASDAQASMQKERDRAVGAEQAAGFAAGRAEQSAAMAKAEAERASSSFSTAMGMAQPLGQTLREFVTGDMRMVTPAVLEIIDRTDESYKVLEAQDAAAPAQKHAEFLVTAAQALCDVGHLTDCVTRAEQAIAILDAHPPTEAGAGALRAEALYARGNGLAATGRMAQARKDLTSAVAQAASEARTATWTFELARVNALSELTLAELDRWALALDSAEQRYQKVIAFLGGHPLKDPAAQLESDLWMAQALTGMALSATTGAEQERRFATAGDALERLLKQDPDNVRLTRVHAEFETFRSRAESDMNHSRQATAHAAESQAAGDRLSQRDRDNLQWQYVRSRTQRAVAYVAAARKDWPAARAALEPAERTTAALVKAEPLWRQARYLHGATLYDLADVNRGEQHPDRATALATQARDEFVIGVKRAPGDMEFVRGLPIALGGLARERLDRKDYDNAIQLAKQALAALVPAERGAPGNTAVLMNKQYYYWVEGAAWAGKSSWKEAVDAFTGQVEALTAIALATRLASDESNLASGLLSLGSVLLSSGDRVKAAAQYDRAADAVTRALAVDPANPDSVHEAVQVRGSQFGLMTFPGDLSKAFDRIESASTLVWNALLRQPWNTDLQADLERVNGWLGSAKSMIPTAGLPPAEAAAMTSRIDPMLAERQASKIVNWIIRPMMPGAWRNLIDQDKNPQLSNARAVVRAAYPEIHADQILAVRTLPLAFRKNGDLLYEAGIEGDNGERSIVAFVDTFSSDQSSARFALIDGSFSPLYQLNAKGAPLLETQAQAEAFFRFASGIFHGNLGPYALVERAGDVLWLPDAGEQVRAEAAKHMVPMSVTRQPDGTWAMTSALTYGTTLYLQRQTVNAAGKIEFGDLTRLMSDLPVAIESITANAKTLRGIMDMLPRVLASDLKKLESTPNDADLLADAVRLNQRLGHLKDAAPLQARLVEVMKADKAAKKEDLLNAYISLSWYQLFARDFTGTLASAEEGHKLDPDDLYLETNRAHALLFLGRVNEAEAVYRAHLGKKLSATSNLIWEAAILQDFDDLEKAGITSPNMARIKKIMGSKQPAPDAYLTARIGVQFPTSVRFGSYVASFELR